MNTQPQWVSDTPINRAYHNKKIKINDPHGKNLGVFEMHIYEANPDTGEKRPGFIIVGLSPHDETAGWTVLNNIGKEGNLAQ